MTARECFTGKIAAGMVSKGSGERLLGMIEQFQREHEKVLGGPDAARAAASEAADVARGEAAVKADQTRRAIIAQADTLDRSLNSDTKVRELRAEVGTWGFGNKAPPGFGKDQSTLILSTGSVLAPMPFDMSPGNNVFQLAKHYRSVAHSILAETIEALRPRNLGFTPESVNGLDLLRALYGRSDVNPEAPAWAQALQKAYKSLADSYRKVGGQLGEMDNYRINNPELDAAKVRAIGPDRYKQLLRDTLDRERMIDYATNKPMNDARFEQFLDEHAKNIIDGEQEILSSNYKSKRMLANERDYQRVLNFKDAESWMHFAETVGRHADVFETIVAHVHSMADDIARLELMGPNPEAWKRFVLDMYSREAARLKVEAPPGASAKTQARYAKRNKDIASNVNTQRHIFENLYSEISGQNKSPVSTQFAAIMGDIRNGLSAAQLGSAMLASLTDPGTVAIAARFNGLSTSNILGNAVKMMTEKGSEIYTAQNGLLADTFAYAAGQADRMSGENIRTGLMGKLANANIRLSGLRKSTQLQRNAFGMEWMAHMARERGLGWGELDPKNIEAFQRYGITAADWDVIRAIQPHEPRPNAILTRPLDVLEAGHEAIAKKLNQLIHTEIDHAVIDQNPLARALVLGQSRPGTVGGEVRRAAGMYQSFPVTLMLQQYGRAFARGWDGSRLGHAAIAFITMTGLGALAMQAKEIAAGRDPLSLNPTERHGMLGWGRAVIQGGGLGRFGDILALDQTKYGNSWATMLAGPQFSAAESILGDFMWKNVQAAAKGKETHFLGDALYTGGRYMPGSSLWFARTTFQRSVLDQLALMIDPRAPERFRRMEDTAQKEFGQQYWFKPGRTSPSRAPDLEAVLGAR